jgi:hypothetical protein
LPDIFRYGVLLGLRITAKPEVSVSIDKEALSRWYSVVHVVARERRTHQGQLAEAATSNASYSEPSGKMFQAKGGIFENQF